MQDAQGIASALRRMTSKREGEGDISSATIPNGIKLDSVKLAYFPVPSGALLASSFSALPLAAEEVISSAATASARSAGRYRREAPLAHV